MGVFRKQAIACTVIAVLAIASPSPSRSDERKNAQDRIPIGTAEINDNGTIQLHLIAPPSQTSGDEMVLIPWTAPEEQIGYGDIEINPWDAHYADMLRHVRGLKPGETKPVPPWTPAEEWHCAIDPQRRPCPLVHRIPVGAIREAFGRSNSHP